MPTFLGQFGYIGILLIIAILVPLIMILLPIALRYVGLVKHKPNPIKNATYESGMQTVGPTWIQFNFRYYLFALIFLAFDVDVLYLFPVLMAYQRGGNYFELLEFFIFIMLISLTILYAWRKGVFRWK